MSDHKGLRKGEEVNFKANFSFFTNFSAAETYAFGVKCIGKRYQDIAILMYKVRNDLVPSYISEMFTRKGTRYNLRNSDFEIPRFNTIRYGKHTLRCQRPYIWFKLENSMRVNYQALASLKLISVALTWPA